MKLFSRLLQSPSEPPLPVSEQTMVQSLVHTRWAEESVRAQLPREGFQFRPADAITDTTLALCHRLLEAFARAMKSTKEPTAGMWKAIIFETPHYRQLSAALQAGQAKELASVLAGMFQNSCMYGVASGNLYAQAPTPAAQRIWYLKGLDNLLALAEFLGVARTECPEQGQAGYGYHRGLNAVAADVATVLGIDIDFPHVGSAYGLVANGAMLTMESPEHLYAASRLKWAISTFLPPEAVDVVEIGGGFGGLTYWNTKLLGKALGSYTIVDLPLINVLQGYFLSMALGLDAVRLYGEEVQAQRCHILPTSVIPEQLATKTAVLINENSMPEMPEAAVRGYIDWARRWVTGLFFSYNQEAYAPFADVPQVLVAEIMQQAKEFERVSRTPSWVRRGYVEEIYRPRIIG